MGVYRRGGGSLDAPSERACERWEQFRLGFIIYFPWSRSRAVLEGPLSLYIYYTYQLMIQLLAPHASDQTFRAVAMPSQSLRLIHRTDCSLAPHWRIFSHSRSSFSLAALEPSVLRPDYHLAPFSDRRPTPLRFVAQAHCQHIILEPTARGSVGIHRN